MPLLHSKFTLHLLPEDTFSKFFPELLMPLLLSCPRRRSKSSLKLGIIYL